jgi:hypothetical protein
MPITFGRVVHPPFRDRLIPDAATHAWDDLGQRNPIGAVFHTMVGTLWGTDRWFRHDPESGRWPSGLTDYGVGGSADGPEWDGVILRWNDPRGRRSGWANGGSDGLEGDGPLFVRTLGIDAINRDLVSIERSDGGDIATPISPKQFESMCALTAYWFDQARVPWDSFPINANVGGGIVTHFLHKEFATKGCPWAAVESRIDEVQERIRQILRAAQTNDGPEVEPIPAMPDHGWWPQGYGVDALRERFGTLSRHEADGSVQGMRFDPNGVISNAWVARGVAEQMEVGELPGARDWWSHPVGDGRQVDVVTFTNGWTLLRPDRAIAWRWVA